MKKVAIIDDAILIRKQLIKFFEDTIGMEVIAQGQDGEQAVNIYKEKTPDLITIDLIMPNKSGLEAIDEIIEYDSNARILIISVDKTQEKITKALNLGAKGFILKPLDLMSDSFVQRFKDEINDALQ